MERKELLAPQRPQVPLCSPAVSSVKYARALWSLPWSVTDVGLLLKVRARCGSLRCSRLWDLCVEGPDRRGVRAAQNPDLQQLLQMWRAGRVSLLAVVLNYVLSSVSTKLGAGAHRCILLPKHKSSKMFCAAHTITCLGAACLALCACFTLQAACTKRENVVPLLLTQCPTALRSVQSTCVLSSMRSTPHVLCRPGRGDACRGGGSAEGDPSCCTHALMPTLSHLCCPHPEVPSADAPGCTCTRAGQSVFYMVTS